MSKAASLAARLADRDGSVGSGASLPPLASCRMNALSLSDSTLSRSLLPRRLSSPSSRPTIVDSFPGAPVTLRSPRTGASRRSSEYSHGWRESSSPPSGTLFSGVRSARPALLAAWTSITLICGRRSDFWLSLIAVATSGEC
eukprot:scaffold74393_cov44-Prasinocladus_malaysianus.AAC.1